MIERIDHINIVVSDLNKAKDFFAILGFHEGISSELDSDFLQKVTGINKASGKFVALQHPNAETVIELLKFDDSCKASSDIGKANQIGFRHIAFAVSDIETVVQELKKHEIEFLSPIQTWTKTGKKLVYFYGPDGILLELAQYP